MAALPAIAVAIATFLLCEDPARGSKDCSGATGHQPLVPQVQGSASDCTASPLHDEELDGHFSEAPSNSAEDHHPALLRAHGGYKDDYEAPDPLGDLQVLCSTPSVILAYAQVP